MKLNALDWIAILLVFVGGMNWGLVGLFDFDLIATIFGALSLISRIIYVLVALAAIYLLIVAPKFSKKGGSPVQM